MAAWFLRRPGHVVDLIIDRTSDYLGHVPPPAHPFPSNVLHLVLTSQASSLRSLDVAVSDMVGVGSDLAVCLKVVECMPGLRRLTIAWHRRNAAANAEVAGWLRTAVQSLQLTEFGASVRSTDSTSQWRALPRIDSGLPLSSSLCRIEYTCRALTAAEAAAEATHKVKVEAGAQLRVLSLYIVSYEECPYTKLMLQPAKSLQVLSIIAGIGVGITLPATDQLPQLTGLQLSMHRLHVGCLSVYTGLQQLSLIALGDKTFSSKSLESLLALPNLLTVHLGQKGQPGSDSWSTSFVAALARFESSWARRHRKPWRAPDVSISKHPQRIMWLLGRPWTIDTQN